MMEHMERPIATFSSDPRLVGKFTKTKSTSPRYLPFQGNTRCFKSTQEVISLCVKGASILHKVSRVPSDQHDWVLYVLMGFSLYFQMLVLYHTRSF